MRCAAFYAIIEACRDSRHPYSQREETLLDSEHSASDPAVVAATARLRLRWLTLRDDQFILELLTDPAFVRNIGDRGVKDLDGARSYLQRTFDGYAKHGFGLYAMELKQTGAPIGMCGLLRRDTHPDVEIGFALLPQFRQQGFTLEACRAVLRLATTRFGLSRVVAIAAPFNRPSIHILELLGMRYERRVFFSPDGSESSLFALECAQPQPGPTP